MNTLPTLARTTLAVVALCTAGTAALAQYKVVGPDGRVTYTDRPPADAANRVTTLGARGSAVSEIPLPLELRDATTRYPATLYVTTEACAPCDAARQLLRQRGVPFLERQVVSREDSDALQRLIGSRDVPALSLGAQTLNGLAPDVWNSYLDAAGYPRESRLPAAYRYPAAAPLVPRAREVEARAAPAPVPSAEPAPSEPPAFRF